MNEDLKEYFIPAKALEHPQNGEDFNLHRKIEFALLRLTLRNNFFEGIELNSQTPSVFIKSKIFDKNKMGYKVLARVS